MWFKKEKKRKEKKRKQKTEKIEKYINLIDNPISNSGIIFSPSRSYGFEFIEEYQARPTQSSGFTE